MQTRPHWILVWLLSFGLSACVYPPNNHDSPPDINHLFDQTLWIDDIPFKAVIFDTPEKREQGFMWISDLPKEKVGLFIFDQQETVSFWMKNTLIPLDILFFDQHGVLIHKVISAQPCHLLEICASYTVSGVGYVVETAEKALPYEKLDLGRTRLIFVQ